MMNEKWNNYFFGKISEEEKQELFRELEQDTDKKREFARMQNVLGLSGLLPQEEDQRLGEQRLKQVMGQTRKRERRNRTLHILRYVASTAAVVMLTWLLSTLYMAPQPSKITYTEIKVPKGQRVHLTLPDGSEAWLSSLSTLRWPSVFSAENRTVTLNGEGFFTVAKDVARPFTVKTDKYNVQVLGTVFNVYAYNDSESFETDLLSGKVSVSSSTHPEEIVFLSPNQKVLLVEGKLAKMESHYSGKEYREQGIYDFEEKTLGEILERLEQWYDVKFTIGDQALLNASISGKFRQSDQIETILSAIRRAELFNYKIVSQREIKIY